MNKEFLIDKISRLLGVSSSEKEFAFQIFIEKTAEVLSKNEALKYPGIGFFYFKEDASKPESLNTLLFVPIMSELDPLADNFFLSFDVKKKNWSKEEFDPSVFSLSIDKSTLPFESETQNSSDISYHLLKKTIEERVEELISSAMHLENFNISDSFAAGNMENVELSSLRPEKDTDPVKGQSYEEMVFSRMNFEDSISGFDLSGSETGMRVFEMEQESNSSILPDDSENLHQIFYEDNKIEFEPEKAPEPETIIEMQAVPEEELNGEEAAEEINLLPEIGKDYEFVVEKGEEKEDLEWSWSQEPSKEGPVLENLPEIIAEKDLFVTEAPLSAVENNETERDSDPFAELEEIFSIENIAPPVEIRKEDPEITKNLEEELSAAAVSVERKTEEIPAVRNETSSIKLEQAMNEEKDNNTPEETNPYSEEDNSKRNMLLIGALVVIGLVAVYIIFFEGFGLIKKKTTAPPKVQTENQQAQTAVVPDSSNQPAADAAKPVTNSSLGAKEDKYQKVKESQAGNILREMKSESKVGSNIYTEGGRYFVQVSSWKNLAKAEQEANKLKAKGNDAFVVKAYIEQFKGTWYRVRVGGFKSKEEAEAFSAKNR